MTCWFLILRGVKPGGISQGRKKKRNWRRKIEKQNFKEPILGRHWHGFDSRSYYIFFFSPDFPCFHILYTLTWLLLLLWITERPNDAPWLVYLCMHGQPTDTEHNLCCRAPNTETYIFHTERNETKRKLWNSETLVSMDDDAISKCVWLTLMKFSNEKAKHQQPKKRCEKFNLFFCCLIFCLLI